MAHTSTRHRAEPRSRFKSPNAEVPVANLQLGNPYRRGGILTLVTVIVLTIFAARLIDLQAVRGESLAAAALDQRLRTVPILAGRGAIIDTNGEPLAVTMQARNLTVDQTLVTDPTAVAIALSPILGLDIGELITRLTGERKFVYVAKDLTPQTWRLIEALRLPGVFSEETARRIYPGEDLGANVIGFVGADGVGAGGIEYAYEAVLAGTAGSITFERGPGGRVIPTAQRDQVDATAGASVQLTINRDIQYVAQEAIAAQVAASRADSGTVVVLDPKTGQILALAEAPTFDANRAGASAAANRGNRALSSVYEPGSTSKVMTLAAVVDQGMATPYSTFTVPSGLKRGDKVFHDSEPHGTLRLTLAGVMAKSSNMGTILAAERIGGRTLYEYLKKFGIGEKIGLNFPGESPGKVPKYKDWSVTSFPTIAFGQGLSVNAVQAASVYATIANDGVRVQPSLVAGVLHEDGLVERPPAPTMTQVVSAETAKQVRAMLESVVGQGGTGVNAKIPGYRIGGKTGTAMYVDPACGCYNGGVVASFIGMAPADNAQLVVAVSVVNPRIGRYGGELAAPVFKEVMTYALQTQRIPPTGTRSANLALTFSGG
ncbi:cell division protein [Actinomycetes bacterium]|nr:cell division protein [Actinomycetes bacterium]